MDSDDPSRTDEMRAMLRRLSDAGRSVWTSTTGRSGFEDKGDGQFDPVTELDRAIETAMRDLIAAAFPADAIWGEEYGWSNQGARRTWSLDPVDGTRALICGLPSWAILVGVIEDGRHVAGMIDLPELDERLVASQGRTWRNAAPVRSSGCRTIGRARLSTTDPDLFDGAEADAFSRVRSVALVTRYGLDALAYARVSTGDIDLVVENKLGRHDLDALIPVVRGAGGHVGDWAGGEDWDGGRIVAAASRALYDQAVSLLRE